MTDPTEGTCTATLADGLNPATIHHCIAPVGHYDEARQPEFPQDGPPDPRGWHHTALNPEGCRTVWSDWADGATPHREPDPAFEADATSETAPKAASNDELRRRIARAIHRYDNHHALSGNDIPSKHHHGEADYVLAELQPELDALAALRQVARGYCPHCGRGDAAPTTADWERERQRADQVEELLRIAHETSNTSEAERARAVQRAERAEEQLALHEQQLHHLDDACMAARNELTDAQAAIRRVLDFAADIERSGWTGPAIARRIRETLGQTAAGHTATQTTDNPAEPR
jgi:hypothetical protein